MPSPTKEVGSTSFVGEGTGVPRTAEVGKKKRIIKNRFIEKNIFSSLLKEGTEGSYILTIEPLLRRVNINICQIRV